MVKFASSGHRKLLLLSILLVAGEAFPQQQVTLSGRITGASGRHPVYVALWDASGFLTKPIQQIRIESHSDTSFRFQVRPGTWALSAYEDENENGQLDMGIFGPKERSGFWQAFHGWHKPRFSEVSSVVDNDTPNANIELRK